MMTIAEARKELKRLYDWRTGKPGATLPSEIVTNWALVKALQILKAIEMKDAIFFELSLYTVEEARGMKDTYLITNCCDNKTAFSKSAKLDRESKREYYLRIVKMAKI